MGQLKNSSFEQNSDKKIMKSENMLSFEGAQYMDRVTEASRQAESMKSMKGQSSECQ